MFIFREWENFCKRLNEDGINSVTASSVLENRPDKSFLILKHDVETNLNRALMFAKIENRYHHKGTYYIQGYLLHDEKNISIMKEIKNLGHEVSYHHDVMDSNNGDMYKAKEEFEHYIRLFENNGFTIKTVCQHGNPLVERNGYNSNRDFFRDLSIKTLFKDISEIMVNFRENIKLNYIYISDAGYGWKIINDPENNDIVDSSYKDISLKDLNEVAERIINSNVILSVHPHRWNSNKIRAKMKKKFFDKIKSIAKLFYKVPVIKKIMHRFYFLSKKI